MAMSSTTTVTIPQVELTLDQLIAAIRQLEPDARSEIAKVLMEAELDARMTELINSLANRPPADDISDADIVSEVNTVREQRRQ
jgi:hypothetical protein